MSSRGDAEAATIPESQASPSPSPHRVGTQGREQDGLGGSPKRGPWAVTFRGRPVPEEREYLWEGRLPRGYVAMIYADGGTAKSLIALAIAIAVASARARLLGRALQNGPVLYLDFELDEHEQHRRAYQVSRGMGLEDSPEKLLYMSALGYRPGEALDAAWEVSRVYGVVLLVLDSYGFAMEGDALSASDVLEFSRKLDRFRAIGVTVLIIDHQAKQQAGQRYRDKTAYGSAYKFNSVRSSYQLEVVERDKKRLTARFWHKKHSFGPLDEPFDVRLSFGPDEVTVDLANIDPSRLPLERNLNAIEKVKAALREGPAYPAEIAETTELAEKTVKNKLTDLRRGGAVEPTGERDEKGTEQVRLASSRPYLTGDGDGDGGPDGSFWAKQSSAREGEEESLDLSSLGRGRPEGELAQGPAKTDPADAKERYGVPPGAPAGERPKLDGEERAKVWSLLNSADEPAGRLARAHVRNGEDPRDLRTLRPIAEAVRRSLTGSGEGWQPCAPEVGRFIEVFSEDLKHEGGSAA